LGERGSHPTPIGAAGLTCPGAAGLRRERGSAAGGCRGFDVDLTSAENGSAGAGRCFVRPWVTAVTPLCVNNLRRSCLLPVRTLTGDKASMGGRAGERAASPARTIAAAILPQTWLPDCLESP